MFYVLVLLIGQASIVNSLPLESTTVNPTHVVCPFLTCPYLLCKEMVPMYYDYHGKRCEGCSRCAPQSEFECPMFRCLDPGPCNADQLVFSNITIMGHQCRGCPHCVVNDVQLTAQKRQHVEPIWKLCPIVDCFLPPPPCSVPLVRGHITGINNTICPTCLYCPEAKTTKLPELTECPLINCLDPGPCDPAHLVYSNFTTRNGLTCRGCPRCVAKSSFECPMFKCVDPGICDVDQTLVFSNITIQGHLCRECPHCVNRNVNQVSAEKRQIVDPIRRIPICPLVSCIYPPQDCPVPLVRGHITGLNNAVCPGCLYCPVAQTVAPLLSECPLISCVDPGPCSLADQVFSNITINGITCRGCPHCVSKTVIDKASVQKRQIPDIYKYCPIVDCFFPPPKCLEPLVLGHIIGINNTVCPGCLHCPQHAAQTTTVASKTSSNAFECPMIKCLDPGACSVDEYVFSNITVRGHVCRGCPHCARKVDQTTTRKPDNFQIWENCPIVDCFFPPPPCSVPLIRGHMIGLKNTVCPTCLICPEETASTVPAH